MRYEHEFPMAIPLRLVQFRFYWSSYSSFGFIVSQERVGILNTLKKEARITEAILRVCLLDCFHPSRSLLTFCALRTTHCYCVGEQSRSCSRKVALELVARSSRIGQGNSQEVEDRCREGKVTWRQVARTCYQDTTCVSISIRFPVIYSLDAS